jgi:hypothetical protein
MHTEFWSRNLKEKDHLEDMQKWEENIRMDLREIGWKGVEWIHLALNRDQRRQQLTSGVHKGRDVLD